MIRRRSSLRTALAAAAALAGLALVGVGTARASIVERVVAVVGERPILLSDLRHRARPYIFQMMLRQMSPTRQAAEETGMFRNLVNKMIDERLEEHASDQAHLSVTPEEVDNALRNVAGQQKLTVHDLVAAAKQQGLTEQDYRDEIRRQVLEGKLMQLRVRGRVRVTDQDARTTYDRWAKEFETKKPVEVRLIAMRIPQSATQALVDARVKLADQIVARARKGEDFCALVREFSDETHGADNCGSTGPQPLEALQLPIQDAIRDLKDGEVADPIRFGNEAILVAQLATRPKVPPFETVKEQMADMAFAEAMDHQKELWLQELRRGVYVDVRL